jgi:hypothetical protein
MGCHDTNTLATMSAGAVVYSWKLPPLFLNVHSWRLAKLVRVWIKKTKHKLHWHFVAFLQGRDSLANLLHYTRNIHAQNNWELVMKHTILLDLEIDGIECCRNNLICCFRQSS